MRPKNRGAAGQTVCGASVLLSYRSVRVTRTYGGSLSPPDQISTFFSARAMGIFRILA